jgi:hypothetical protein
MGDQLELPLHAVLSRKKGGQAKCKTYCKWFKQRPPKLEERLLCVGDGEFWGPCPDLGRCVRNPVGQRKPGKTQPSYSLRSTSLFWGGYSDEGLRRADAEDDSGRGGGDGRGGSSPADGGG